MRRVIAFAAASAEEDLPPAFENLRGASAEAEALLSGQQRRLGAVAPGREGGRREARGDHDGDRTDRHADRPIAEIV